MVDCRRMPKKGCVRAAPACLEVRPRRDSLSLSLSRNLSSREKRDYPSSVLPFIDVVVSQSVTGRSNVSFLTDSLLRGERIPYLGGGGD